MQQEYEDHEAKGKKLNAVRFQRKNHLRDRKSSLIFDWLDAPGDLTSDPSSSE